MTFSPINSMDHFIQRALRISRTGCRAALIFGRAVWLVFLWPLLKWTAKWGLACAVVWETIQFCGLAFQNLAEHDFGSGAYLIARIGYALILSSLVTAIHMLMQPEPLDRRALLQTLGAGFLLGLAFGHNASREHNLGNHVPGWIDDVCLLCFFVGMHAWTRFGPDGKRRKSDRKESFVDA